MQQRRRAYIYVTREKDGDRQLLVFAQDDDDSGIQVPGGGIEAHETPLEGMRREILEEAGLNSFIFERGLVVDEQELVKDGMTFRYERHFFWLSVADAPDTWDHHVTGNGEDRDMVFHYFWMSHPTQEQLVWDGDYLGLVFPNQV
ncbi:MAG TPA: NUDIX domain-containing protein [Ktedonobacterales bacterium]